MNPSAATEEANTISSNTGEDHPLPLNLEFMFGKGFLSSEDVDLSDWLTLESLRMEIPDLSFPFDAGGGVGRFRDTRCQIREVELSIDEGGLTRRLERAADSLGEFGDIRIQFLEDAVHVSLRLEAFDSESHLGFRASLIPPEPPRADELHLSLYDYRWFGPLPYPGRLLAFEWLTGVLNTPHFSAPGRGRPFQVGVAGDIASFRPFKLLLIDLFPRHGWKLPSLAGVVLDEVQIAPGTMTIRASSQDERWQTDTEPIHELRNTREGRRALAAYESKELFTSADEALFAGEIDRALEQLSYDREQYGLHPQLASRLLDCLLADPTTGNLAEARSLCDDLLEDDPAELRAHLAQPVLALLSEGKAATLEAFDALSDLLRERGDLQDWILAELAAADLLREDDPEGAARRLRDVLKATPHSLPVLERLRELYERLGDRDQLEDVLKRLTGVYADRTKLHRTYLELARHLMHRAGELAEARHYLQKALDLDSQSLEALEALGESYAATDKPMRAVKAYSSAARIAEDRGELARARQLQFRVAHLWSGELDDSRQALLGVRRALSTTESELDAATSLDRPQAIEFARQLAFAARLCEQLDRREEAIGHWSEVVNLLERIVDADDVPSRAVGTVESPDPNSPVGRLAEAHGRLADLYIRRDRHGAAENHWRRALELDPNDRANIRNLAELYRDRDEPEKLVELLKSRLRTAQSHRRSKEIHARLAQIFEKQGAEERAEKHREHAERFAQREADAGSDEAGEEGWRHEAATEPAVLPLDDEETPDEETSDEEASEENTGANLVPPPAEFEEEEERDFADEEPDTGAATEAVDSESLRERLPEIGPHDETLPPESVPGDRDFDTTSKTRKLSKPPEDRDFDTTSKTRKLSKPPEDAPDDRDFDTTSKTRKLSKPPDALDEERARQPAERTENTEDTSDSVDAPPRDESAPADPSEEGTAAPSDSSLEAFRSEYKQLLNTRASQSNPGDPSSDTTRDEGKSISPGTTGAREGSGDLRDEELQETVRSRQPPEVRERIELARSSGDDEQLADVLEEVLEARERSPETVDLTEGETLELRRELAELLYFELEETDRARPHLEILHRDDPEGLGGDETVLRALEAIYEREGDAEGQVAVLESQLEASEDPERIRMFRPLLARLYWEELGDVERATELLGATLDDEPDHEGAHRLMADIELERERPERAADHLRTVSEVAGTGIDALEDERRLADVLGDELGRSAEAAEHYERVLEQTPGDSRALEGLKTCRRESGDWEGYLDALAHELGVLTGRPGAFDGRELGTLDPETIDPAQRVPASQILAEAAETIDEQLDDPRRAHRASGVAIELWDENVESIERRIELDRTLDEPRALAADLKRLAELLLDPEARFSALFEAAEIWQDLDELKRACGTLQRAVEAGANSDSEIADLERARQQLDEVQLELDRKGD